MGPLTIFAIGTFLLMVAHPVIIFAKCEYEWSRAMPWIKNDLASHLFLLFVFPFAVGLFADEFQPHHVWVLKRGWTFGAIGLLFVLEAIAAWFVSLDVTNYARFIPPHQIGDRQKWLEAADFHNSGIQKLSDYGTASEEERRERQLEIAKAQAAYKEKTGVLFDAGNQIIWDRGSFTLYSELLFTYLSVGFAFFYFWYLGVVLWEEHAFGLPKSPHDKLILVFCLLLLFFPARIYTEWYLGFLSLRFFKDYPGFWILLVLALFALCLLIFVIKPQSATIENLAQIEGVLAVAAAFVAYWKPEWLFGVGRWFVNASSEWILALGILTVLFLLALTAVVQVPPAPAKTVGRAVRALDFGFHRS
ncbi:MAG: hypothetical protein ABSD53_10050 [Terriglobales bacterium]|jgi:hypothetical protein